MTDGLDGLAGGVSFVVFLSFGFLILIFSKFLTPGLDETVISQMTILSNISFVASGALLGFLVFNCFPATIFMGDTGSMFLGGIVVALAYAVECPIILLPVGIVYVIEALSDVIQIASIKIRHKKVFKMAPIHHHFEMCGWNEKKIVAVFTFVSVIGCALGVIIMKYTVQM